MMVRLSLRNQNNCLVSERDRSVLFFVLQVSSVKVRLSLQRAKDNFDNVYVGVKPGQMLLDLMMRMDSAHIKVNFAVRPVPPRLQHTKQQ